MRLEKITRNDRRGSESVAEEKFFLYFHTDVKLNEEFNYKVSEFYTKADF